MSELIPALGSPTGKLALSVGDRALTYEQLAEEASVLGTRLQGAGRVAVWAEPTLETCVAMVAGIVSRNTVVPINPKAGKREVEHIVGDAAPAAVAGGGDLPGPLGELERVRWRGGAGAFGERGPFRGRAPTDEAGSPAPAPVNASHPKTHRAKGDEDPALVLYTSGTTGMPKGAVLSREAVAFDLDALARAWEWGPDDVLVHGLPLFHVHGLVLGLLGPLRVGGTLHHVGRFSPGAVAAGLDAGGTMMFGVPTMYSRIADAAAADPAIAAAFRGARLLVSGSAPLPGAVDSVMTQATGQRIAERYGLTETIINCAVAASEERRAGYVGPPLPGIDLKLVDDGTEVTEADDETIGEVYVRGPNLFDGYLNRPDATAEAMVDGWFATGDLATRSEDGYVRIVGRKSTDLIKTGGYKVGAGEVENALLEHPSVAEAAVVGEPDDDLGERIVAYVVASGDAPDASVLVDHVASLLSAQKRPRDVRIVESLPRNDMGKIRKGELKDPGG